MGLVILRVAVTEAMRLRRSLRLGMGPRQPALDCESFGKGIERRNQLLLGVRLKFLGGTNILQDAAMLVADASQHFALETPDGVDRNGIEIAARTGKNRDDLLLDLHG